MTETLHQPGMAPAPDTVIYRLATYLPLVGERFEVGDGDGAATLELVAADEHRGAGESFSLRFASTADAFLPQGSYPLAHPALGPFSLFLVPLGPGSSGVHELEAVINQLPEAGSTDG